MLKKYRNILISFLIIWMLFGCSVDQDQKLQTASKDGSSMEAKVSFAKKRTMSANDNKKFSNQYVRISKKIRKNPVAKNISKKDKIVVIEFFSYACPACNATEKFLNQWRQSLGNNIEFIRIPVVYHTGWLSLAKAYYAAEQLNIQDKITPYLFELIHDKKKNLMNKKSLESFFQEHNVPRNKFNDAYSSFYTNKSLEQGRLLMNLFNVYSIPTVIVNNTYKIDLEKVGSQPKKIIPLLIYLVEKVKKENNVTSNK